MSNKWLIDRNGNRCSIEHFGSRALAQEALDSLKNCRNCVNCVNCSYCYHCSDCSDCSDCSRCYQCYGCSYCSRCYGCYRCVNCSDCSRCYRSSYCSRCYGCSDCYRSSYCSGKAGENLSTIPTIPNIHQTVYAAASSKNALEMNTWHTCEETHCRAGWVVSLAGEAGLKLENRFDTCLAAMMIYDASSDLEEISPIRFFETNDEALADMKRLAELEASI